MTDLADRLRHACDTAGTGNKVVAIHLFAIEHAAQLQGVNLTALAKQAGIGRYAPELSKGVKLAGYVEIVRRP